MGQVIKYDPDTWVAMTMLKENIELMRKRNEAGRFDISINKQKEIFRDLIKEGLQ
jgi:hypothetical protein